MSPEEIVRVVFQQHRQRKRRASHEEMLAQRREWDELTPQLTLALRLLTTENGQRIAEEVWRDFDPEEDDYLLAQLGASVPGALATIQGDMIERKIFYPPFLYLDADDGIASKLIEMTLNPPEDVSPYLLLRCLAWTANEQAIQQFQEWRDHPPSWWNASSLPLTEYTVEAGLELTTEGTRRNLYLSTVYEVVPLSDSKQAKDVSAAVKLHEPQEGRCGWCGRQLISLLSLDLHEQRLALLVGRGSLLRIAICPWCSTYTTLFTDVDFDGASSWSDDNEKRPLILDKLPDDGSEIEMEELIQQPITLGALRRTPYEVVGRFMLDEPGISQIGGHPEWIQGMEYPICPTCQRRMVCIAQISWEDFEEYAEGSTYAFVCLEDGKAATVYQQT
jgi:hypothetical protein